MKDKHEYFCYLLYNDDMRVGLDSVTKRSGVGGDTAS